MTGVDCRGYTSTFFEYARVVPNLASPEPVLISRYIWGLISELRNIVKAARPRTIDDAVELANTLTDELIRTRDEDRKKELAQKITQGFRVGNSSNFKKKGARQPSTPPFCRNCRRKHFGKCNAICNFCKSVGHSEENCKKKTGHRKVRPGKLHYEGRGADPLRGGGKAAAEAEDRVDPVLLQ